MFRLAALISAALVALVLCASAAAAVPGPRLAVVALQGLKRSELFTVDALGGAKTTLYASSSERIPAVYPFSRPSWSADGSRLAFTALVGQVKTRFSTYPQTMLALVSQNGGAVEPIAGAAGGSEAVFSPDGTHVAFAKARKRWRANKHGGGDQVYDSTSIWLADLASRTSTQLTPWRNHLTQVPSSFSSDGTRLAFSRFVGDKPPEALEMEFDGSADTVLARNAFEPVYSPDGSQIAFLRGRERTIRDITALVADLYVKSSSGGGLVRLTRTPRKVELSPSWDPSGQRLAYTRLAPFGSELAFFGFGDEIVEMNADGSCETKVMSKSRSVLYAATWQPGAGREAGRISC